MNWWSTFWAVIVWFVWAYLLIAYLLLLIRVLGDIFGDRALNGWSKAVWVAGLVFLPFLTVLAYLVVRGNGMNGRNPRGEATVSEPHDYRPRIIPLASPSNHIATAQSLLAAGSITPEEFAALKAKALL
ncbi:hypothetical protein L1277_002765 [Okibacterium sp. HSC-33S16]|uniref:SHOCT domain-containing protein n=1 Tax=Okibacterium sp. HSC-33S16 TaxID=2910965 RepID=UPI0020A10943|nr:SHOCT domain-containing protein [Okibacterium sp. HSC-33S16]MCP2032655.1 hypothetical protein [Okibacterium sp. HSC-33S16]